MPHQCLGCGEAFADGSTDLLKGCPSCEGTRFFYTAEPLDDAERTELQQRTDTNVREMLENVLQSGERRDLSQDIWSKESWERWVRLERGEDGEPVSVRSVAEPSASPPAVPPTVPRPEGADLVEEAPPLEVEEAPPAPAPEPVREVKPSTLNIVEPGQYEIDVERLMDDSPVIVERDGSYLIHLPSVFAKPGGKKRR